MTSCCIVCAVLTALPVGESLINLPGNQSIAHDAAEHIARALQCEVEGRDRERREHLILALLAEPNNATARSLLGHVQAEGGWLRASAMVNGESNDPLNHRQLYVERRERTANTAEAQWRLALWCQSQKLGPEARAHLHVVTRLDPSRSDAWRLLGYRRHRGRWMTAEQIEAASEQTARRDTDHARWRHRLLNALNATHAAAGSSHETDSSDLAEIDDPHAVPAIWSVLVSGNSPDHLLASRLLGQILTPESSRALAYLAAHTPSSEAQRSAAETLRGRDPREYADIWIEMLQRHVSYTVNVDPTWAAVALTVDFPSSRDQLFFSTFAVPVSQTPDGPIPGMFMAPNTLGPDFERASLAVSQIERHNQEIGAQNARLANLLFVTVAADLGADQEDWREWYADQLGYSYHPKPRSPKPFRVGFISTPYLTTSCFAAGTPVHARHGIIAIEELKVGDQVLSRAPESGILRYRPIIAVHQTGLKPTIRLLVDHESMDTTGIHRFWKAGVGWLPAKALKTGDLVRALSGAGLVQSIADGPVQPVFNLEVEQDHSYLIGQAGILVHDFSISRSVDNVFDSAIRPQDRATAHAPASTSCVR
jgi:Pretoxin HINT domain